MEFSKEEAHKLAMDRKHIAANYKAIVELQNENRALWTVVHQLQEEIALLKASNAAPQRPPKPAPKPASKQAPKPKPAPKKPEQSEEKPRPKKPRQPRNQAPKPEEAESVPQAPPAQPEPAPQEQPAQQPRLIFPHQGATNEEFENLEEWEQ